MKKFILICASILILTNLFSQKNELLVNSGDALKKGIEQHDKGNYEEAIKQYDFVLEGDTNYLTALYEKALSLQYAENYDEAIEVCNHALEFEVNYNRHLFYIVLNACYDDSERKEEALKFINKGIEEFPNYHLMNYNKAITLITLKKYDEALKEYKNALSINPSHFNSHFGIGRLAAIEGEYTKAIFALSTAIALNPNHNNALAALGLLDKVLTISLDEDPVGVKLAEAGEDDFAYINKIIESKAVLDKKYKTKSSIKFDLVNQIHAMFELLKVDKKAKGWFTETYLPIFSKIKKENKFKPFSELLFIPSTNEAVQKKLGKNLKSIKQFKTWFDEEWKSQNRKVEIDGKKLVKYFYKNNLPEGIGELKNDEPFGMWEIYNSKNGNAQAKGNFDKKGKTGEWQYFYLDGSLREKTNYKNGKANGNHIYFRKNGKLSMKGNYKEDKKDGTFVYYDYYGIKSYLEQFKNGLLDGDYKQFYPNGNVKVDAQFKDDKLSGKLVKYFVNKQIEEESVYENGNLNGESILYFINGNVQQEAIFVDGFFEGIVKKYYKSGKLKSEATYKKGYEIGISKEYHENGVLLSEGNYDENGKKSGIETEYDRKGNKRYEQKFKNGAVIEYKFFDREGNVLSKGKKKKKKFFVDNRNADNIKIAEGNYEVGGSGKIGLWKYYSSYGQLESEIEYQDGNLKGVYKEYNSLGNVSTESTMIKSEPYTEWIVNYFDNGKVASNGWKVDDKYEGMWEYFYENGKRSSTIVYLRSEKNGPSYFYDINGKLTSKELYAYSNFIKDITYDTLGNQIQSTDYLKSELTKFELKDNFGNKRKEFSKIGKWFEGSYKFYSGNGALRTDGNYKYNERDGSWKWFDKDENIESETEYKIGLLDGLNKSYYPNGNVESESIYKNDLVEKTHSNFDINGNEVSIIKYENGVRNGAAKYYSKNDELQMVRYYEDGIVIGYSYNNTNGELVDTIKINADGNATVETKYANGKTARKYKTVNNNFDGVYDEYYANGQLADRNEYKMGLRHGKSVIYNESGILTSEVAYDYGLINGEYKKFYDDGKLKLQANYIYGVLHGKAIFYDELEKLSKTRYYYNGRIVKEI